MVLHNEIDGQISSSSSSTINIGSTIVVVNIYEYDKSNNEDIPNTATTDNDDDVDDDGGGGDDDDDDDDDDNDDDDVVDINNNDLNSEWINSSDTHLFTDASGNHGFGAFFVGRWANGRWPNEWVQNGWTKDITMLELFPIVLAVRLWGRHLRNKRVLFVCDNQAVVAIINKQTAKPPRVMSLLRRLILLCLQHNILFKASYIPTHANVIADALSRFQWSRFKEAAPRADEIPAHIPQDIWQI
ncbi:uncharacterized protein [Haliotis cracherodii]|uniref:uncharacterized protein n=1 Tax=Haliotis cracherodii TaxID=6455 RepID=UPI0039E8C681